MNNNMIDLVPYLPRQTAAVQTLPPKKEKKSRTWLQNLSCALESVMTLCIGTGFFIMLAAFFAVML